MLAEAGKHSDYFLRVRDYTSDSLFDSINLTHFDCRSPSESLLTMRGAAMAPTRSEGCDWSSYRCETTPPQDLDGLVETHSAKSSSLLTITAPALIAYCQTAASLLCARLISRTCSAR